MVFFLPNLMIVLTSVKYLKIEKGKPIEVFWTDGSQLTLTDDQSKVLLKTLEALSQPQMVQPIGAAIVQR